MSQATGTESAIDTSNSLLDDLPGLSYIRQQAIVIVTQPGRGLLSMEIARRLYDIARATILGDAPVDEDGQPQQDDADSTDARQEFGPEIDPRLAALYANLEVPNGSDLATVRLAWRRLLKQYHPDLHGVDPAKREVATELTARLTAAYEELEAALTEKESS